MEINPNTVAYAALFVWPLVSLYLFLTRPASVALIWTILSGHLLLPVGTSVKIAMIPALDKNSIPSLCALVGCLFFAKRRNLRDREIGLAEILIAASLVGPFITSMLNTDPIHVSDAIVLPGVGYYDAGSAIISEFIVLIPFFLGRRYLQEVVDGETILYALTIAGLLYTIPVLFEIRMSPQLHTWIYGYFPHQFAQQFRDGGFRAVVFLGHGLLVAFFMMSALVASVALWRAKRQVWRLPPQSTTAWFALVLILSKTLGALLYGVLLAPLVLFTRPRVQTLLAAILVSLTLAYPVMRTLDLVPTETLLGAAGAFSADREASLKVRFDQEKRLLDHASERIWFGWGRYGRGRVYGADGTDESVTDGYWIISVTSFGLFGFLAEFGLLALPVYRAIKVVRNGVKLGESAIFVAALSLIVAIGVVDLIPNSSLSPWSWLLAGALLARSDQLLTRERKLSVKRPSFQAINGAPGTSSGTFAGKTDDRIRLR